MASRPTLKQLETLAAQYAWRVDFECDQSEEQIEAIVAEAERNGVSRELLDRVWQSLNAPNDSRFPSM